MENEFELAPSSLVTTDVKTESKAAFETLNQSNSGSLGDVFDKFQKMIYLFDVSASMSAHIAGTNEEIVNQYKWTETDLKTIKAHVISESQDLCSGEGLSDEDAVMDCCQFDISNELELKMYAVTHQANIFDSLGIRLVQNSEVTKIHTKLEVVKDAAKRFVRQRFEKYPDSQVLVYSFDTESTQRVADAGVDAVLKAIDELHLGGGTDIFSAVSRAVNEFKKRPSHVQAHHIVLVSDGADYGARNIEFQLLDKMKELNIVFDFIYIKGEDRGWGDDNKIITSIQKVCDTTGGDYRAVNSAEDFETKFFAASSRPLLPPSRS